MTETVLAPVVGLLFFGAMATEGVVIFRDLRTFGLERCVAGYWTLVPCEFLPVIGLVARKFMRKPVGECASAYVVPKAARDNAGVRQLHEEDGGGLAYNDA